MGPGDPERHLERQASAASDQLAARDWADVPLAERVELMLRGAAAGLRAGRGLYRALFVRSVTRPPDAPDDEREREQEVLESLATWLLQRRGEISHPDPESAVRYAVAWAYGALNVTILFGAHPGGVSDVLDDERLASELARMVLAYLGVRPKEGRRRDEPSRPRRGRRATGPRRG